MAAFQDTREQTEQKVMVHLLTEIECNPSFTQRHLASELGIALGLMNHYLKRSVTKGWLRASQVSPRRITYFLTPDGFLEKGRMVKDYLARSMTFFRSARSQCTDIFEQCKVNGWDHVALVGEGDLADIARLVALSVDIDVCEMALEGDFKKYQAILITDVLNPQETYDALKKKQRLPPLLTLPLLHISMRTL